MKHSIALVLQQDDSGRTALHIACTHASLDTVRALVDAFLTPSTTSPHISILTTPPLDRMARTPLHCAAVCGRTDIVKYLIEHGHPANCADVENHTPIWYARIRNHTEVVQILAKSIMSDFASGSTPLALDPSFEIDPESSKARPAASTRTPEL